jgi:hypothetical protein
MKIFINFFISILFYCGLQRVFENNNNIYFSDPMYSLKLNFPLNGKKIMNF